MFSCTHFFQATGKKYQLHVLGKFRKQLKRAATNMGCMHLVTCRLVEHVHKKVDT
jgi:hypothetical protein